MPGYYTAPPSGGSETDPVAVAAENLYASGIFLLPPNDTGFGAGALTQSLLQAYPLRIHGVEPVTFASIAVSVSTLAASSAIRLGMYAFGTAGAPGALLYDLGTVDSTSDGVKTIASSFTLGPGMVWIAAVAQGGAPSVRQISGNIGVTPDGLARGNGGGVGISSSGLTNSAVQWLAATAACAGALPNPFGAIAGSPSTIFPRFELQVA